MTHFIPWPMAIEPAGSTLRGVRRHLAAVLHRVAAVLAAAARHIAPPAQRVRSVATMPRLEFHAEAGAPEGALYVDGVLFGRIQGVRRL